jgi:phosphatidylserine/phosphatidylglycerophosphate/cardiolipin synthase-like enzyme
MPTAPLIALSLTVVRRVILQEGVDALAAAGIPIWIDVRARIAREKALIIDRGVTIMGSYNWTKGAASNSEDLNVVTILRSR